MQLKKVVVVRSGDLDLRRLELTELGKWQADSLGRHLACRTNAGERILLLRTKSSRAERTALILKSYLDETSASVTYGALYWEFYNPITTHVLKNQTGIIAPKNLLARKGVNYETIVVCLREEGDEESLPPEWGVPVPDKPTPPGSARIINVELGTEEYIYGILG